MVVHEKEKVKLLDKVSLIGIAGMVQSFVISDIIGVVIGVLTVIYMLLKIRKTSIECDELKKGNEKE